LKDLSECIEEFFESKGFETLVEGLEGNFKVIGVMRVGDKSQSFYASIKGSSSDFTVEFSGAQNSRFSQFLTPLITMFGGGILILKKLQSQEFYEKLETEFWAFVEHKVDQTSAS
jgi:hypothetical protein